ncbi:hypothetical protein [Thiolapillus sp.]|uniref:hypothetical protein n=2 Tax=Thiolapillus sp. TaxID=2017437 RepID=UPI003AF9323C
MGRLIHPQTVADFYDDGGQPTYSTRPVVEGEFVALEIAVLHTDKSTPSVAKVTIHNLSSTSISAISQSKKCQLWGGYDGELITMGIFDVVETQTIYNRASSDPGWQTVVGLGDGESPHGTAVTSKNYEPGASIKSILSDIGASFGLVISQVYDDITSDAPMTFDGTSAKIMDDICRQFGLQWSITDDVIQVTKKDIPVQTSVPVLTDSTGLLGIPVSTQDGLKVEALLFPSLRARHLVKVQSETAGVDGFYRIKTVSFQGNNYSSGQSPKTRIEGVSYDNA